MGRCLIIVDLCLGVVKLSSFVLMYNVFTQLSAVAFIKCFATQMQHLFKNLSYF